jgi:hypothetical protein
MAVLPPLHSPPEVETLVGRGVKVNVGSGVSVAVGVKVAVGVAVAVSVGVAVKVAVGVFVEVAVAVKVGVGETTSAITESANWQPRRSMLMQMRLANMRSFFISNRFNFFYLSTSGSTLRQSSSWVANS